MRKIFRSLAQLPVATTVQNLGLASDHITVENIGNRWMLHILMKQKNNDELFEKSGVLNQCKLHRNAMCKFCTQAYVKA